jgi:hypothetical protein
VKLMEMYLVRRWAFPAVHLLSRAMERQLRPLLARVIDLCVVVRGVNVPHVLGERGVWGKDGRFGE